MRILASASVPSAIAKFTMPSISFQSAGWMRWRTSSPERTVASAGSPTSRAASASNATVPDELSQLHRPVPIAARISSVRIAPL